MWYVRIGSRLRGPFSEDQLKLLRKRGDLSSVHQVSQDQKSWQAAGELFKQWESKLEVAPTAPTIAPAKPATGDDAWYFSSPSGESIGPMSKQQLIQLTSVGQLTDRTVVYGPGLATWTAASKIDFLTGKTKRVSRGLVVPVLLVSCLMIALLGLSGYVIYLAVNRPENQSTASEEPVGEDSTEARDESTMTVRQKVSKRTLTGTATKINAVNHKQIKEALARVQIIRRTHFTNGSVVEEPIGHGTGFCVTPTGYFLTNRHVVETYSDKIETATLKLNNSALPIKRDMGIVLFIQGIRFEAKLIHTSSRFDLAVVKTNRLQALPYFAISSSDEAALLKEVYALGFPGVAATPTEAEEAGLNAKFESECSRAIAEKCTVTAESQLPESAFGHSAVPGSITKTGRTENGQLFVYHSATIFGGNSGGPLVDKRGLVVGINTAIRRDLDVKEVTLSDGSKGVLAINDGNLNQAYLTGQFREELKAYVPEKLHWQ